MTCDHCGATVYTGLALCDLCQQRAHDALGQLPVYFRNLARWRRPNRPNGSLGTSGSWMLRRGEATGADKIGAALDRALTMLRDHAEKLANQRHFPRPLTRTDAVLTDDLPDAYADALIDHPARWVTDLCQALDQHLTSIATTSWCSEFVAALAEHDAKLCSLTETAMPGWYAGACKQCAAPTYVVPGLTWMTCRQCGTTSAARDHLDVVLDEARDWIARPRWLAEAIVALVDTEQSVPRLHKRIKKWQERGRIEGIWRTERTWDWDEDRMVLKTKTVGYARLRLGDVLDVLLTEEATRLPTRTTTAS